MRRLIEPERPYGEAEMKRTMLATQELERAPMIRRPPCYRCPPLDPEAEADEIHAERFTAGRSVQDAMEFGEERLRMRRFRAGSLLFYRGQAGRAFRAVRPGSNQSGSKKLLNDIL
jgi:hypothetical protein